MSQTILLVIHIMITAALIGVVLIQRSEGGGLGMGGGGGGGMGPFMSVRGTANLLTRATTFLAICFVASNLILAILASNAREQDSIVDGVDTLPPAEFPAGDGFSVPEDPSGLDGPAIPLDQ